MSDSFKIELDWLEGSDRELVERESFAQIVVSAGNQITTELEDLFSRTIRPGPRVSAHSLAFWLVENWWRLRWEPESKSTSWRLSHVVAAAGGGFAWPDLSFASDGVHVLVEARSTFDGSASPVRYIRDVDVQISAAAFEAGIDEFVERVLARLSAFSSAETDLSGLWRQLRSERDDHELARTRQLEALLGFDPDEAPDGLMGSLRAATPQVGVEAVDEIAAAAKEQASRTLEDILRRARDSAITMRVDSTAAIRAGSAGSAACDELPWQRAARVAKSARDAWGIGPGPVGSSTLADCLQFPETLLDFTQANGLALGDTIVASDEDRLLPATFAKTDRQKFQRAFAQEFLLPFDELRAELGAHSPSDTDILDEDIEDVARRYEVSPLVVRTTLVNKGVLPRESLAMVN